MHPACERQVGLALLQPGHRLMDGYQRRRAGGIDGDGRPLQSEREGDPSDGGVVGGAADRIQAGGGLGRMAGLQDEAAVFVVADTPVYPGAAALQGVRVDAGIFERLPTCLQHQPLLGVQELRLDR